MHKEGISIRLTLRSKDGGVCNVLGSFYVVGQNIVCGKCQRIVMVGKQIAADTTSNSEHARPLLV